MKWKKQHASSVEVKLKQGVTIHQMALIVLIAGSRRQGRRERKYSKLHCGD
jgi:hypothetical protein